MSDPDVPKWQDLPEAALLLVLAGSFAGVGTESLMNSDVSRTAVCYLIGTLFFVLGVSWYRLKQALGPRVSETVTAVASDFRWWLAILGVVFLYVGYPTFSGSVRDRSPAPGPNSPQAIAPRPANTPIASFPALELSPEVLHRLTNDELRIKAYSVSEQVNFFASMCGSVSYAVDTNKEYDNSTKALEKIKIDSEINSAFHSKLRDPTIGLFNELGSRISKDNVVLTKNTVSTITHPGIISQSDINDLGYRLVYLAKQLP